MEEYRFNNVELNDEDKKVFDEIKRLIEANSIGEAIKQITHAINNYINKALLVLGNFENGVLDTPGKQKEAFIKIIQDSLKASLAAKELRKFYHL